MAFDLQNLGRVGSGLANGPALWSYGSADDAYATIGAADYFLPAINELEVGDQIYVVDSAGVATITYVSVVDLTPGAETISVATGNTITA